MAVPLENMEMVYGLLSGRLAGLAIPENIDLWADWRFDHWGPWLLSRLLHGGLYLAGAVIAHRALVLLLRRAEAVLKGRDGGEQEAKRDQTLIAVTRRTGVVVIYTVFALVVASDFGVQVGPLIAGMGIAGVALGFGAQYLVKDVITGFFLIFERQFALDDVVMINGITGSVEEITLRTTRLRSARGELHVIPNGEIRCVTNLTHQWARAVVDVGVAYRSRLEEVFKALEEVAARVSKDEKAAAALLEKPEVVGVTALGDSAVTVRIWAKTKSGKQWETERLLLRMVKEVFDERGIEMPFPQRTVSVDPQLASLLSGRGGE